MRELYAVDLRAAAGEGALHKATALVTEWAARPSGIAPEALCEPGHFEAGSGAIEVGDVGEGAFLLRWSFPNAEDPSLRWFSEVALGVEDDELHATIRIRIGQREGARVRVGPIAFEFASPAIVRTLLREFEVCDAGTRVSPGPTSVGHSGIDDFVAFLLDADRSLPVVALTLDAVTGATPVDPYVLAKQVAGLAHVRVLTSPYATRRLGQRIGTSLSVWGGSARIYFPDFSVLDEPYQHKLWSGQRLANPGRLALEDELRRWLGNLSSARTAAHPATQRARGLLAERADELPEWAQAYVDQIEDDVREIQDRLDAAEAEVTEKANRIAALDAELETVKRSFGEVARYQATGAGDEEPVVRVPTTVEQAVTWAIEDAEDRAIFLPSARRSGLSFSNYADPEKLYRAISDVAEASAQFADGSLGMSLGQWFSQRGYGYNPRNNAASAAKTKQSYKIRYNDKDQYMEPHLKVDEATSPDQCLRIYWYVDEEERTFVVGHIGAHLPD